MADDIANNETLVAQPTAGSANTGGENGTQGTDVITNEKMKIQAMIAAGDLKGVAALSSGDPEISALIAGAKTDLAKLEGIESPQSEVTPGTPGAPTTKVAENEPEKPSLDAGAAGVAVPTQHKPPRSTSELIDRAINNDPKIIELAIREGAGYAQEAKSAIKAEMQFGVSSQETPGQTPEKAAQAAAGKVDAIKSTANAVFESLIKQGSMGVLYDVAEKVKDYGTGNMGATGGLAAATMADTAVTTAISTGGPGGGK